VVESAVESQKAARALALSEVILQTKLDLNPKRQS
jgi:hypothetical protein